MLFYDKATLRDAMLDIGFDPIEKELYLLEYSCEYTEPYSLEVKVVNKAIIRVEGMSCGHCEIAVADAVRKLPGIIKVKASRRKKEAVVQYEEGLVTPEQIMKAILDAGYDAVAP